MLSTVFLACVLALASVAHAVPGNARSSPNFNATCNEIAKAVSSVSEVFFPPSPQYAADNAHAFASSSAPSTCSVEPGSAADVSVILRILGETRTPFAVKGGGHATNPGFSSTSGVQIALARFDKIEVHSANGTVDVGPGLTWDTVYATLDESAIGVVGGRIPGVGVAGLTLGGGYSFKTSQYGLAIDNIVGYELVLPNGTVTAVTEADGDLWFALRGGLNNFGIVTKFSLRSHPQGQVWGGSIEYGSDQLDAFKDAVITYQKQNDTKAALVASVTYSPTGVVPSVVMFYDAPTQGGIFDDFLSIPAVQQDVSSRSYSNLVSSLSATNPPPGFSGFMNGIPVTNYSSTVIDALVNQTIYQGAQLALLSPNILIAAGMEPFASTLFTHGSASAYPPDRSTAVYPTVFGGAYTDPAAAGAMARALREGSDAVHAAALADGQDLSRAAVYPNYALFDTPLEDMYGANLERLRTISKAVDPEAVMGLTGGFKF
ncbi:FAD dependent oxidoreductase [Gloeopeniophorella convolvens]|nr:FAD dependent oxidoreductase [Gloeopeniophorella convolvens]